MKKALLFIVLFLFLLLTACGTAQEEETPSESEEVEASSDIEQEKKAETSEGDVDSILDHLELSVSAEQKQTSIDFSFELVNKNEQAVDIMFSSGQQYEIEVYQEEALIYQFSEGKMFTEALIEESLKSGEMKKWTETWEITDGLKAGDYQVKMSLLPAEINGEELEGEHLTQSIELSLNEMEGTNDENSLEEPFRSIEVEGNNGEYLVTGEIDTSIGDVYYEVEDGHNYLVEKTEVPVDGEGWQSFEINVTISEEFLPENGTMIMLLYSEDRTEQYPIQLDQMP
ncbi:BsuPI-related putative proteinase inhibitor [Gracilibacillus kekensis]|uniref:Intracellular proteinase inhibitor n=1 Tax=Gracilibacillus kekensis TaxID=1027249 RepID=A0A1M7IQ84_9BACI|nr:BsuPI-related putative proteinase inhibitor [Gracilibacillus kekensis]SHM42890.1 Intracellular proteinase inhibitor [Gracilibacillus kekensis]